MTEFGPKKLERKYKGKKTQKKNRKKEKLKEKKNRFKINKSFMFFLISFYLFSFII